MGGPLCKIVSGGQTGVDRAALDAALEAGVASGGWCPLGRLAEDGRIPAAYPMEETPTAAYAERTEWNVRDSDGTLILAWGMPEGGTRFTIECAVAHRKPVLLVNLRVEEDAVRAAAWLEKHGIGVLNVAGPRGSTDPRVYDRARAFVTELLAFVRSSK